MNIATEKRLIALRNTPCVNQNGNLPHGSLRGEGRNSPSCYSRVQATGAGHGRPGPRPAENRCEPAGDQHRPQGARLQHGTRCHLGQARDTPGVCGTPCSLDGS